MPTQQPPDRQQAASSTSNTNRRWQRPVIKKPEEIARSNLEDRNSELKDENKKLGKQIAALRSELAQAQAALSKRSLQELNPFTKLAHTYNYEVSVPLVSHDQINKNFLSFLEPELTDMHQKNNLLRFVLFGKKDTWFCFKDVREKSFEDIEALPGNPQDFFYYQGLNHPHNNSDCKFMIRKFKSDLVDRIALRGFQRPS